MEFKPGVVVIAGCEARRRLAEQSLEEAFKENAVTHSQPGKLNSHTFVRHNATYDRVRLHAASRHFKDEHQSCTHGRRIGTGDEQTTHPQGLHARNLLPAATVPRHIHTLRQGDSFVSAWNENCFLGHAVGNTIRPLEFQAPEVEAGFLKLQAKFPVAPVCLPGPNKDNFTRILIGQINQP